MKKIILVLLTLLTTGCWDAREIKDLGIVNSWFFDYKEGNVIFMAEIVNPKTQSSISPAPAGSTPYIYIRGIGKKILDATNNSTLTLSKYLYDAHVKAIFMTESFAKEVGLVPIMDLFSRYQELRQSAYMVVIKDKEPEALYKSSTSLADFFGDFIEDSKKTQSYRQSKTVYTNLLDVIKAYYCNMEEPVLGVIQKKTVSENEVDQDNPLVQSTIKDNTKLLYEGFAVFEKSKLKYVADGEDTLMYNFIQGTAKAINMDVDKTTFKILTDKPSVDIKYKDKKLKINVKISLEMMAIMDEGKNDFNNLKTISKFEKKINDKYSKQLKDFLDKSQQTIGVDFLNFANSFHIKYPDDWKKIKKDWDKYFKKADISVKVKSAIKNEGKIQRSVRMEE